MHRVFDQTQVCYINQMLPVQVALVRLHPAAYRIQIVVFVPSNLAWKRPIPKISHGHPVAHFTLKIGVPLHGVYFV